MINLVSATHSSVSFNSLTLGERFISAFFVSFLLLSCCVFLKGFLVLILDFKLFFLLSIDFPLFVLSSCISPLSSCFNLLECFLFFFWTVLPATLFREDLTSSLN